MQSVSVPHLMRAAYSNSPLSFPVSKSDYMYAQFKNISSTPAPGNSEGVSIAKLRVIDTLIGKLKKNTTLLSSKELEGLKESQLSSIINDLSKKVHNDIKNTNIPGYSDNSVSGLILNTFA